MKSNLRMKHGRVWIVAAVLLGGVVMNVQGAPPHKLPGSDSIVRAEFIYESAPFPSCHASTLVEVEPGVILAAWFGGTDEGEDDVGIWLSRRDDSGWSTPVEVASAEDVPCWNPVLFKTRDGEVQLWYKAGESPMSWSGLIKRSSDNGRTWSEAELLPAGILGPIKNKPIQLDDGTIVCGTSVESWRAWCNWIEVTPDNGKSWRRYGPIEFPGEPFGLIQPSVYQTKSGALRFLCRSRRNIGYVCVSESRDGGVTWDPVRKTDLPHPNAGVDAVAMRDGRIALVYNHTPRGRTPLNVGVSEDDGDTWVAKVTLEDTRGEYSYPAVIQTQDGMIHTTYTWKRELIKYVVMDPSKW